MSIVETPSAMIGLRERGKIERLRRIKDAALHIFRTQGYERSNTREIARLAGVATGTLFLYARDKRDLLFLVVNDDLDAICETSIAALDQRKPVVAQLTDLLRPIYDYFAAEPGLARTIQRESVYFDTGSEQLGEQYERFHARLGRWRGAVNDIIAGAIETGQLDAGGDAPLLSQAIFDIHLGEIGFWLRNPHLDAVVGIGNLVQLFTVVIAGRERR